MSQSISALEELIRERINARRKQHELLARSADWNSLCSALDVVGDTEIALDSYLQHPPVEDVGTKYLHVYGALQLLQTQQDAASAVCVALRITPTASPKIPLIRDLRSSSVGHPTRQHEDKQAKSSFIVRVSLSQFGFTLFTVTADDRPHTERTVNIPELVELQRKSLAATLTEVVDVLDEAEMKHRQQHKDKKLASCFPATLGYYFSKIFEGIHSYGKYPLGKMHVELVAECLTCIRAMLEERGDWGIHDSVNYEFELLEYPIQRLLEYFTDKQTSGLNDKDAFVFCSFLQHRLGTLQQIAGEIDETYESSPRGKK